MSQNRNEPDQKQLKGLTTPFSYELNKIEAKPTMVQHLVKLNQKFVSSSSNTPRSTIDAASSDTGTDTVFGNRAKIQDRFKQAFEKPQSGQIEGDRFICFRAANEDENTTKGDVQPLDQKFDTKIELFKIDHQEEEKQRKNNQLVCDHQKSEQTIQELDNKKTYVPRRGVLFFTFHKNFFY